EAVHWFNRSLVNWSGLPILYVLSTVLFYIIERFDHLWVSLFWRIWMFVIYQMSWRMKFGMS
ncbi:MAG: hypothetical protein ACXVNN_04375, partial [Bacteroidia bacterium]